MLADRDPTLTHIDLIGSKFGKNLGSRSIGSSDFWRLFGNFRAPAAIAGIDGGYLRT